MSTFTLTARWVFPVAGPPLSRGTVTIERTRIVAVEPCGIHTPDTDLGNVALIPGLVNPHTHLDLSGARGLIPPAQAKRFPDWLLSVIAYRRSRTPEQVAADIRAGLSEAMRFGTTLLGDITADGQSWATLAEAPVRAVVFRELIGLSKESGLAALESAVDWLSTHKAIVTCRPGLSPHSPYSACADLFDQIGQISKSKRIPMAVHLAESREEVELVYMRRGPFVDFLKVMKLWNAAHIALGYQPIMRDCDHKQPRLFVHGNYLPTTMSLRRGSALAYCPRTHAAFGHAPHPFRNFLSRDNGAVGVCLATDGLSSNPDLDPLAEARFLHAREPDLPGDLLLKMITQYGAEALGWGDECGTLKAGRSADLVAVPLPNVEAPDPHDLLLADFDAPRQTMFRGQWREQAPAAVAFAQPALAEPVLAGPVA